jgi:hypothetical protein
MIARTWWLAHTLGVNSIKYLAKVHIHHILKFCFIKLYYFNVEYLFIPKKTKNIGSLGNKMNTKNPNIDQKQS